MNPSSPDYISTCAFTFSTDDNAALYDGSIIGAPLPAGYQQAFDWYYTDWQSCLDTDTGDTVGYIEGYGLHNTGQNGIPRTATHWTPNNLAWQFTGGAWVFYNLNTAWNTCAFAGGSTTFPARRQWWWRKSARAETEDGFSRARILHLPGQATTNLRTTKTTFIPLKRSWEPGPGHRLRIGTVPELRLAQRIEQSNF